MFYIYTANFPDVSLLLQLLVAGRTQGAESVRFMEN